MRSENRFHFNLMATDTLSEPSKSANLEPLDCLKRFFWFLCLLLALSKEGCQLK
jgi:hypothetical protein